MAKTVTMTMDASTSNNIDDNANGRTHAISAQTDGDHEHSLSSGTDPTHFSPDDASTSNDGTSTCIDDESQQPELPFHRIGLIGRSKELRLLQNAFQTTCMRGNKRLTHSRSQHSSRHVSLRDSQHGSSSHHTTTTYDDTDATDSGTAVDQPKPIGPLSRRTAVLIGGHSGSGKTALAMQVKRFIAASHASNNVSNTGSGTSIGSIENEDSSGMPQQQPFYGFFVSGKCEISKMNAEQPYAGIKSALASLCNQILCLPRDENQLTAMSGMPSADMPKASGASPDSEALPSPSSLDDPRRLSILRRLLKKAMSRSDIQVLSNVIPELPQVISGVNIIDANGMIRDVDSEEDNASMMSASTSMLSKHSGTRPWHANIGYRAHGDRLKFALQRLIQIICNYCPLIFVIDDLQWADKASLDIFKSWMLDSRNTSLMIIGCYRSNLLEENDALKTTLTSLDESKRERSLRILKLPIEDLEGHHINELLCCLLCPRGAQPSHGSDRDCYGRFQALELFANVVYKKTGGNPFFVQRFLHSLVHEGLLKYNGPTQSHSYSQPSTLSPTPTTEQLWDWTWNDDDIQAKSPATSNIIELMKEKLRQVQEANQILPIAACLGASFSYSTICIVMRGLSIHSAHSAFVRKLFGIDRFISTTAIRKMLHKCTREGLLEKSGGPGIVSSTPANAALNESNLKKVKTKYSAIYNFSHDKVQEAALDMVDQQQLSELKYRVGEILLFGLSEDELEERIFMVTNLINARPDLIPDTIKSDRGRRVMMLNFDAGTKAASCSAFHLALEYFRQSIELLPTNHWKTMKVETLQIYSAAAESAYVTSKLDRAREYCDVIISSDCDILEKIDAYDTLTDVAMAESQKDKKGSSAVRLCVDVLSQLGCKLPKPGVKRQLGMVFGLLKSKRLAHKMTAQTIEDLPLIANTKEDAIMRTLGKLMRASYFGDPDFIPSVALETLRRTFKHGVSEHSPPAFTMLGLVMGYAMGDFEARMTFTQASFDILSKLGRPATEASIILQCYILNQHWKQPVEEIVEPIQEAYRLAVSVGDMDVAGWCMLVTNVIHFFTGTPLSQIDYDSETYSKVLLDFRQSTQYTFLIAIWQMVLNLRGTSKHHIALIGDAFDERSVFSRDGDNAISGVHKRGILMFKTQLCAIFGDYEQGAKISVENTSGYIHDNPGGVSLPPALFRAAFNCLAASHSAPKREYSKVAKQCLKQLKQWNKQGNPNCPHYIMLLKAERHFLRGNHSDAAGMYVKAIESAGGRGYTQDQAIANERLGDCWMDCGRKEEAKGRYEESIRLYDEWGAAGKVVDLHAKVGKMFG